MALELPAEVVAEDRSLGEVADRTAEELGRLRWHWTLNGANPGRVSFREYARQVGRTHGSIYQSAKAYEVYRDTHTLSSFADAYAVAGLSAERAEATEAVAEATGAALSTVSIHKRREVQEVLEVARERVERKGTNLSEEIRTVAHQHARTDKALRRAAEQPRDHSLQFLRVEGKLAVAKRMLTEGIREMEHVDDFTDEELALIRESIANVRQVLEMFDVRAAGTGGIDWDAELERLTT